jgi:hypothetical protein
VFFISFSLLISSFPLPFYHIFGGDAWWVDGAPWKPQLDARLFYFRVAMMCYLFPFVIFGYIIEVGFLLINSFLLFLFSISWFLCYLGRLLWCRCHKQVG